MTRRCCNPACGAEITLCNGFVVARDTLPFYAPDYDPASPPPLPRELCGRCVERASDERDPEAHRAFLASCGLLPAEAQPLAS